ncbi:MAG: hypothetical protein IPH49_05225 [Ignavibacteria bacterium]|nr:hypothetical protein [Ignavibacteria bacterium]
MMRLATVQFCPAYRDPDANTDFIVETIASTEADVIVFPELATSGYFFVTREEVGALQSPLPDLISPASSTLQKLTVA